MNKVFRTAIPVIILLITGSCSTKKNTVVTRTYHNMTSHYNIYFNAYDSYYQGIKKAESSFKDDFNTQLPLFTYSSKEAARIILADMDKTVKKCSKVIGMHSIKAKPKLKKGNRSNRDKDFYRKNEYVKWVDDAFLLMGKAYFYKRDFFPAIETLEYVLTQFPDDGLANEASLWLAMTQLELKRYPESQQILNRLQGDPKFDSNLKSQLEAVYGDWYLRQGDLITAIPLLEKAAGSYPSKLQRTRVSYVLGQVYEKSKDSVNASKWYTRVNEMNPSYDMAFNARINRARLYQGGGQSADGIRKELMKMLKDAKNVEFLDQVYYALAELEMKQGNESAGINFYKKSVENNVANATQKGLSYLALASYYYGKEEFVPAGLYYDSCSQSLPDTYPDHQKIIAFGEDVKMLSENISMAQREDSLQAVAKMPQAERDKLISDLVAKATRIEEEKRAAQEEERMNIQSARMNGMNSMTGMNNRGAVGNQLRNPGSAQRGQSLQSGNTGQDFNSGGFGNAMPGGNPDLSGNSSWYFYNPAAISFGGIEFIKFWGRRKLEDNWRRSNKKVISEAGDLSSEGETGEISTPVAAVKANTFKPTQREFYMNDLPMNDTLLRESNIRIAQAFLNTGKIFKDELNRPNEAIQYFDKLNRRFPEDERLLFSYYNMYQIYTALKIDREIQMYKDLILQKFPDSRSAKIISNPDYFKQLDEERASVLKFYEKTYADYKGKSYAKVLINCAAADTAFKVNPIRDKFGLLRIMAFAKQYPADTAGLVKSINDLVFKYPESEVAEPAKNLLSYIQKGPSSAIGKTTRKVQIGQVDNNQDKIDVAYFPDDAATHFYAVVVSAANADVGKLKFRVSNFNVEKYDEDFFEVASTVLDGELQIITVKNFSNKKLGMDYYQAITADPKVYEGMKDTDYRHFVISKDNYTRLYKNKNVFQYYQFFRDNYLKE
ncbi:MAG: tetratricopeptide repeat protein [Bacteroidales bacterium]